MDGTQGAAFEAAAPSSGLPSPGAWQPSVVDPVKTLLGAIEGLDVRRIEDIDTLVIAKTLPGFDRATVDGLRQIVSDAGAGRLGRLKFLVFDFVHEGFPLSLGADGFDDLLVEIANLILAAPVVSIACARANLAGADMEFALACSMLIGEDGRRFSFAADPTVSISTYGLLAQKIGFVRAERLMEKGDVIDAAQMHDLLLLKEVLDVGAGEAGIEAFAHKTARRHNACYGIYRAQRMTTRPMNDSLRA